MVDREHSGFVPEQEFTLAIYDRLIPLVATNIAWWRDAVWRWAFDPLTISRTRISLPLLFQGRVTDDDKIAILAAIYDTHAVGVAKIDPWLQPAEISENVNIEDVAKEYTAAIRGYGPYLRLRSSVLDLGIDWIANKAAIEMFLVQVERILAETEHIILTKEAAEVLQLLAETPVAISLEVIMNGTDLCHAKSTAKKAVDELIAAGYAIRPHGPNKGVAASNAGLSVAAKLGTKSAQA